MSRRIPPPSLLRTARVRERAVSRRSHEAAIEPPGAVPGEGALTRYAWMSIVAALATIGLKGGACS